MEDWKKVVIWRCVWPSKKKGWKPLGNNHMNSYNMIIIRGNRNLMRVHIRT
jgi:hypothetical protein